MSDFLADGDEILFQIDSINFWLRVTFNMYINQNSKANVEGSIELRIDKSEKILSLKKRFRFCSSKFGIIQTKRKQTLFT